jgi:hypothetical protein
MLTHVMLIDRHRHDRTPHHHDQCVQLAARVDGEAPAAVAALVRWGPRQALHVHGHTSHVSSLHKLTKVLAFVACACMVIHHTCHHSINSRKCLRSLHAPSDQHGDFPRAQQHGELVAQLPEPWPRIWRLPRDPQAATYEVGATVRRAIAGNRRQHVGCKTKRITPLGSQ